MRIKLSSISFQFLKFSSAFSGLTENLYWQNSWNGFSPESTYSSFLELTQNESLAEKAKELHDALSDWSEGAQKGFYSYLFQPADLEPNFLLVKEIQTFLSNCKILDLKQIKENNPEIFNLLRAFVNYVQLAANWKKDQEIKVDIFGILILIPQEKIIQTLKENIEHYFSYSFEITNFEEMERKFLLHLKDGLIYLAKSHSPEGFDAAEDQLFREYSSDEFPDFFDNLSFELKNTDFFSNKGNKFSFIDKYVLTCRNKIIDDLLPDIFLIDSEGEFLDQIEEILLEQIEILNLDAHESFEFETEWNSEKIKNFVNSNHQFTNYYQAMKEIHDKPDLSEILSSKKIIQIVDKAKEQCHSGRYPVNQKDSNAEEKFLSDLISNLEMPADLAVLIENEFNNLFHKIDYEVYEYLDAYQDLRNSKQNKNSWSTQMFFNPQAHFNLGKNHNEKLAEKESELKELYHMIDKKRSFYPSLLRALVPLQRDL